MHTQQDPLAPSEFSVRGHAWVATDQDTRRRVADAWSFEVDEGYGLFVFDVQSAILGARPTADAWPPIYTAWRAAR